MTEGLGAGQTDGGRGWIWGTLTVEVCTSIKYEYWDQMKKRVVKEKINNRHKRSN